MSSPFALHEEDGALEGRKHSGKGVEEKGKSPEKG
jgi:hypothetical protein